MTRISNSLFESIRQVTHPVIAEAKVEGKAEEGGRVDGAHYCATWDDRIVMTSSVMLVHVVVDGDSLWSWFVHP